jgi:hypothetical protein
VTIISAAAAAAADNDDDYGDDNTHVCVLLVFKVKGGACAVKECYFPRVAGDGPQVLGDGWRERDEAHGRGSTVSVTCDV